MWKTGSNLKKSCGCFQECLGHSFSKKHMKVMESNYHPIAFKCVMASCKHTSIGNEFVSTWSTEENVVCAVVFTSFMKEKSKNNMILTLTDNIIKKSYRFYWSHLRRFDDKLQNKSNHEKKKHKKKVRS